MREMLLKLGCAALLPAAAAGIIYLLDKKTAAGRLPYGVKQLLCGLIFGGIAIFGTEFGIPYENAVMNCRDAAVLAAGLFFGGPAGILAGLIGGIERWVAVAWGVGTFTRTACSISTAAAGIYAAALRRFMFEKKRPPWLLSLAIGIVMEVIHLTMVFLTNINDPVKAIEVVRVCSAPMILANGISVMLTGMLISLLAGDRLFEKRERILISQTVQRWLLVTVLIAFFLSTGFVYRLQFEISERQTESLLTSSLATTVNNVRDASDRNMLSLTERIRKDSERFDVDELARIYSVAEISIINEKGIIVRSTDPRFIGYDMASGEQSAEFLCLLEGSESYIQKFQPISFDSKTLRKYAGVGFGSGFIQIGYDEDQFQSEIAGDVQGITANQRIGENGFVLILNKEKKIVSGPEDLEEIFWQPWLDSLSEEMTAGTGRVSVNGEAYYFAEDSVEGYRVLSFYPEEEAHRMRNIVLYVNTFMEVIVFAILFSQVYQLIKNAVVKPIQKIGTSLEHITQGDLEARADVRTNEELALLSDGINSTVSTLKRYIDEAAARIDKELEMAKRIQSSALPQSFPKRRDVELYADMIPARQVGGDFYDFYLTADGILHFLAADVSDKGIPAAMFMMRAKTELKTLTEAGLPVSEVFVRANEALCGENDAGMFVTAWQGGLDLTDGTLRFANAGHNPPAVRKKDGRFELLPMKRGMVLGGLPGMPYPLQEWKLEAGDTIFLYTDGVTEATNSSKELYGETRMLAALDACGSNDMKSLCTYLKKDIDAFVGDAPQFDDITMVALHYTGRPQAATFFRENAVIEDITELTDFIDAELEKLDCPTKTIFQINIVVDEVASNIVRYAYPEGSGPLTLRLTTEEEPRRVRLVFEDTGIPYNPLTQKDPDVEKIASADKIGGLGIYMVKRMMDELKYEYENDRNILTLVKKL